MSEQTDVPQSTHTRKYTRHIVKYRKDRGAEKEILELENINEVKCPKDRAGIRCVLMQRKDHKLVKPKDVHDGSALGKEVKFKSLPRVVNESDIEKYIVS